MLRALSRNRLAAIGVAAGAAAATYSAVANDPARCLSIVLDEDTAHQVWTQLSAAKLGGEKKKNTAFVFAKPHANTPGVLDVIKSKFAEMGISILKEGTVTGEEIDKNGFIDQHYYAIGTSGLSRVTKHAQARGSHRAPRTRTSSDPSRL
jgi:hypothetical protein